MSEHMLNAKWSCSKFTRVILAIFFFNGVCSCAVVVYHSSLDPFVFLHGSVSTILGGKLRCSTLLNLKLQNPFSLLKKLTSDIVTKIYHQLLSKHKR